MRNMKLIINKRKLLWRNVHIKSVLAVSPVMLDGSLYRELEQKYGWLKIRIQTALIIFRSLNPAEVNPSVKIIRESAAGPRIDIRTDASFRMEVINLFKQQALTHKDFRPSYQDMVLLFSMMRLNSREDEFPISTASQITKKDIKNMFLKMMEQAYISYLQGGRQGLKSFIMYQDTSHVLKLPGEQELQPAYLPQRYRYERETLIYSLKEQESIQKEIEVQKITQNQMLERFQKKMVENNQKDVKRIVEQQVNQWAGGLSEKVYQKLEKKLENERKRRGF